MRRSYYKDEKRPAYCTHCGTGLIEKFYEDGYDQFTGSKLLKTFLVCPKTHLNYDKHDAWEVCPIEESLFELGY